MIGEWVETGAIYRYYYWTGRQWVRRRKPVECKVKITYQGPFNEPLAADVIDLSFRCDSKWEAGEPE